MKSRLLSSSKVQPTRKVVIRVIVRDAHHVRVFKSLVPRWDLRVVLIAIRIRRKVASVLRVSVPVCKVVPLSAASVLVHNMVRRVISLVSRVISPVKAAISLVNRAIVPTLISRLRASKVISLVRKVINPVSRVVMASLVSRPVTSVKAVMASPVSRPVTSVKAVIISLVRAATVSPVRVAMVSRVVTSVVATASSVAVSVSSAPVAMTPMPSIA